MSPEQLSTTGTHRAPRPEPVVVEQLRLVNEMLASLDSADAQHYAEVYRDNRQALLWELTYSRICDLGVSIRAEDKHLSDFVRTFQLLCEEADTKLAANDLDQALHLYREQAEHVASLDEDSALGTDVRLAVEAFLHYLAREYEEALRVTDLLRGPRRFPSTIVAVLEGVERQSLRGKRITRLFRDNCKWSETRATHRLTDQLGMLLERFNATSGFLFTEAGDKRHFEAIIWQYSGAQDRDKLARTKGIVGQVFESGKSYLVDDASEDPYFVDWEPSSKSALAAPIFSGVRGQQRKLVGVICLESARKRNFSPGDSWELESLSVEFVHDLLTLKNARNSHDESFSWHFLETGWGLSELLRFYSHGIVDALTLEDEREPESRRWNRYPSCTIWYHDSQKDEEDQLWVQATARFDYGYVVKNHLPVELDAPDGSRTKTLTGSALSHARGQVTCDDWQLLPALYRRDKAKTMGLRRLSTLPIYLGETGKTYGCLNSYSFFEHPHPAIPLLRHTADLLGWQLHQYQQTIGDAVEAWTRRELVRRKCLSPDFTLQRLESLIRSLLGAPACSIFIHEPVSREAPDNAPWRLQCVATTGLEHNGEPVYLNGTDVYYDSTESEAMTIRLAMKPGGCERRNHVPSGGRRKSIYEYRNKRKFVESLHPSETDHRRVLAVSLCEVDDKTECSIGVLRVVRTAEQRPFIETDGMALQAIAHAATGVIEDWRDEKRTQGYVDRFFGSFQDLVPEKHADNRVATALKRLIRPLSTKNATGRSLVDEILQSLLQFFYHEGSIHCSLREACYGEHNVEFLKLTEFHSVYSPEWPDEVEFPPPVYDADNAKGSIAWRAIKKNGGRIVAFDFSDDLVLREKLFRPISDDSADVKSGICVPIKTLSEYGPVTWVLSLDFEKPLQWTSESLRVVLLAASKLAAILGNCRVSYLADSEQYLRAFLAHSVERLGGSSGELDALRTADAQDTIPVVLNAPDQLAEAQWRSLTGDVHGLPSLRPFHIEIEAETKTAVRLSLPYGPELGGRLICRFHHQDGNPFVKRQDDELVHTLKDILGIWGSMTVFPGDQDVSWKLINWSHDRDEQFPGLQYIRAFPALISMTSRNTQVIKAELSDASLFSVRPA